MVHEVSPLAGIATLDLLCARGYRPIELSSVLHRPVDRPASESQSAVNGARGRSGKKRRCGRTSARGDGRTNILSWWIFSNSLAPLHLPVSIA